MFQHLATFLSNILDIREQGYEVLVKKPFILLGRHGLKVREMFTGLPRRQAVTIYAGMFWTMGLAFCQPFVSVYLVGLGLSQTEVGLYQSLMNLVSLVGYFVGGYFSDTWGRKRALILFDIISWGGYCLCMALADNKYWCIAALFFMASNALSLPPYQCLLVEGISAKKKAFSFTILQMMNFVPALFFFYLLGGLWVLKYGLVTANHQMYWLLTCLVFVGIGFRWKLLPESSIYETSSANWFKAFKSALSQYRQAVERYFKKPGSTTFLFSKFLDEWMIFMWNIYASLYYVKTLGLKDSYLSVLTEGSSYVGFLILFFLIPNLTTARMISLLGLDQVFGLAAFLILLLLGHESWNVLAVCLLSASMGAAGYSLYSSISAAVWMNIMDEKERAKAVAASIAFIKLGITLTGAAASYLYGQISPLVLLWLMVGMRAVNFVLLRRVAASLGR